MMSLIWNCEHNIEDRQENDEHQIGIEQTDKYDTGRERVG